MCRHMNSKTTLPNKNTQVCLVCGKGCHEKCGLCDKVLHYTNIQPGMTAPCFMQYHNTSYFGLARDDWKITGAQKKHFTLPDEDLVQQHAESMRELKAKAVAEAAHKLNNSTVTLADSNPGNNDSEHASSTSEEGTMQGVSRSEPV